MRRKSITKFKGWNDEKALVRWVIAGCLTILCSPSVSAAVVSDLFGAWNGTWFVDEISDELNPPTPISFSVDVELDIGPFNPSAGNYGTILLDTATPGVISSITVVGDSVELLIDYPWANYEPSGLITGILTGNTIVGDFDEVPTAGYATGKGAIEISKISAVSVQGFVDVPTSHWASSFIEILADSGITSGCDATHYCPSNQVTRAQMAVFLERGMRGSGYNPGPSVGNIFLDVSASYWAAGWIEQLSMDGITSGCGNNNYCPGNSTTRAEMAIFLLRAKYGQDYAPPTATGDFNDVPLTHWAAGWIEQLAAEGITSGCGGGNYCPDGEVTRAQMAVFLVKTFGLTCNGCNNTGGGTGNTGGCTGNVYGCLSISGASQVPGTFAPDTSTGSSNGANEGFLQTLWHEDNIPINSGLWSLSASIADNYQGISGANITFGEAVGTTYTCESGFLGAYGDCSGASFNHNTRTVTFSNVLLQGPGFGAVITLNGTLKY